MQEFTKNIMLQEKLKRKYERDGSRKHLQTKEYLKRLYLIRNWIYIYLFLVCVVTPGLMLTSGEISFFASIFEWGAVCALGFGLHFIVHCAKNPAIKIPASVKFVDINTINNQLILTDEMVVYCYESSSNPGQCTINKIRYSDIQRMEYWKKTEALVFIGETFCGTFSKEYQSYVRSDKMEEGLEKKHTMAIPMIFDEKENLFTQLRMTAKKEIEVNNK